MENTHEKYLPLGSILMLKNGKHKVMIIGYCIKAVGEPESPFYDYIGCLFPEGIFTFEQSMVFNHEQIKEVYHLGFMSDEVKIFHKKLKDVVKKIENKE